MGKEKQRGEKRETKRELKKREGDAQSSMIS